MIPLLPGAGPEYGSSDAVSERSWKNQRGVQKLSTPYPNVRRVPSAILWSQSNRKQGEVDGSRKNRKPRFQARTKLRKEEDMVVGRQESLRRYEKGAEPETRAGF
jgi:hypothetical protein